MSTNRPRKNIYLDDDLNTKLRDAAYINNISESEICRQALTMYFDLTESEDYQAAQNLADQKGFNVVAVLLAALNKQVPAKYYPESIE